MAGTIDISGMKDALVVLGAASVVVPLVQRLKINPIIGFLIAGIALGPNGLGAFTRDVPLLDWVTIGEQETIASTAELGVAFLLFVIGLELSFSRLATMRRLVFGLGAAQVVVSSAIIASLAAFLVPGPAALMIGAGMALSSTAIVIESLAAQKRTASAAGRAGFAVLIFQDLAVVPILFFVDAFGQHDGGLILQGLGLALLKAMLTIAAIVIGGRFLLKPLFRLVANPRNPELFMAATLLVAIGTGVLADSAGLSMALGAFVAGLLLAETEYRRAIETAINPFKSLLLGVFFFAAGMSLDLATVLGRPWLVGAAVVIVILVKAIVLLGLARLFRVPWKAAIEMSFLLAPSGEFAFVVFGAAATTGILAPDTAGLAVAIASLSMAIIPPLGWLGRRIGRQAAHAPLVDSAATLPLPENGPKRAIVVGYGRVGRLVANMLERHNVPHIAIDADATLVARLRKETKSLYWGDATKPEFLERCDLAEALAIVVTLDGARQVEAVVDAVKSLRSDLVVVARARDADHARRLYAKDVTDAVPETIEASLQLSEAALVGLGVPIGPVIASIHERRDEFRRELQGAAGRATRAVRPKSAESDSGAAS